MKIISYVLLLLVIIAAGLIANYGCTCDPVYNIDVWLVSPDDEASIDDPEVTLVWNYSTEGSGDISHEVYTGFASDSLENVASTTDNDTTYLLSSLQPLTTYYWTVVSRIHHEGKYHYSYADTFTFATAGPFWDNGYPHDPYPDSGAVDVDSILTMYWSVYNPESEDYSFDVYLGTTSSPGLMDAGLSDTTRGLDTLAGGTTYYWRVEAISSTDTTESNLWHFTTRYAAGEEVFAFMEVDAKQAPSGYHVEENIRARFDTAYASVPVNPVQAESVYCEDVKLQWNDSSQSYSYTEFSMPFIENGAQIDLRVFGNSDVPSLTTSVDFPACTLSIISPETFDYVSINGFEVTWAGDGCGDSIWLCLMDGTDSTGVLKHTENDGVDSLTANDLQALGGQTGDYDLLIIMQLDQAIDAPGYLPESHIRARVYNVMAQIRIN